MSALRDDGNQLDDYADDGFGDYAVTTLDGSPWILIATVAFCCSLYLFLPCVVALLNACDRKNRASRLDAAGAEATIPVPYLATQRAGLVESRMLHSGSLIDPSSSNQERPEDLSSSESGHHERGVKANAADAPPADEGADFVAGVIASAPSAIGEILDAAAHRPPKNHCLPSNRRAHLLRRNDQLEQEEPDLGCEDESDDDESDDDHDEEERDNDLGEERDGTSPELLLNGKLKDKRGISVTTPHNHVVVKRRIFRQGVSRHRACFGKLLSIVELDLDTRKIYKLAIPYFCQAFISGIAENGILIVIGQLVGTRELAAFAIVDLLVGLTAQTIGGFMESLTPLLSFSRGTENSKLTGEYVQLAMIFTVIFTVPFIVLWSFVTDDVMRLLGFGTLTAEIGQSFAVPYMLANLLRLLMLCIHAVMDVNDLEVVSTVVVVTGKVTELVAVLVFALLWDPTLQEIGFVFVVVEACTLLATVALVGIKGWFRPFYGGFFRSAALKNSRAIKMMAKTAASLAAGYVLAYGEWEILAFFASALGPAEVSAWSILGTLWGTVENVTEAIANAGEVRVATLLGSGQPGRAKKSAYKSICIAFVFALLSTSIIFIAGESIPVWLTTDPLLQNLIADLIPLFGLGNITLTMGTMAWTLIGAQNRYRLATFLGVAGSWFVVIPMSAVMTIVYRINLQGQTAAVVIGYMLSGFVMNIILLRSDWKKLSDEIILYNAENDISLSSDSDDDGDSSSSSSSSSSASASSHGGITAVPPSNATGEGPTSSPTNSQSATGLPQSESLSDAMEGSNSRTNRGVSPCSVRSRPAASSRECEDGSDSSSSSSSSSSESPKDQGSTSARTTPASRAGLVRPVSDEVMKFF